MFFICFIYSYRCRHNIIIVSQHGFFNVVFLIVRYVRIKIKKAFWRILRRGFEPPFFRRREVWTDCGQGEFGFLCRQRRCADRDRKTDSFPSSPPTEVSPSFVVRFLKKIFRNWTLFSKTKCTAAEREIADVF